MTNRTKSEFTSHCRIAAKTNFLMSLFSARFAHAPYSSRMIDRFLKSRKAARSKAVASPPWRLSCNTLIVSFRNLRQKKILHSIRRNKISSKYLRLSGVEAESFESWYSWFPSFLPQWFMIPTRIQIHDSRRLLITYWLNDFLRGNLVSFCVFWSLNFCFIQTWYGMECCCNWTLSTRLLEKQRTVSPECTNYIGGAGGMFPRKNFENWTLGNAISCIPWIERN